MSKINVGVLRGGPSRFYDMSLISGQHILDTLDGEKYNANDVFIDKNENWHLKGLPVKPAELLQKFDVVFNAMHGSYGADGRVQSILEQSSVPFTGPKAFAASVSLHKGLALETLKKIKIDGLKIQYQKLLNLMDFAEYDSLKIADDIFMSMAPPYIIKPLRVEMSGQIFIVNTKEELANTLEKAIVAFEEIVVEEFLYGKEVGVSVVEGLRGEDFYCPPPLEILSEHKKNYPTESAFIESVQESLRYPAQISQGLKESIIKVAKDLFKSLSLRHYARLNFIVSREKDIYFLSAKALPGLGPNSFLPRNLQLVGVEFSEFVDNVIELALNEK